VLYRQPIAMSVGRGLNACLWPARTLASVAQSPQRRRIASDLDQGPDQLAVIRAMIMSDIAASRAQRCAIMGGCTFEPQSPLFEPLFALLTAPAGE
jgi:hypothetical protein